MALYALIFVMAAGSLLTLSRWRYGLFVVVALAAFQDPVRKLVSGAPGYLVLATAPVLVLTIVSLIASRRSWWRDVARSFPAIDKAMTFFMLACIPPILISATYGPGSWMLTLLGIFSYGTILMLIVIGYHFPRNTDSIRQLLGFYCVVTSVMLIGGPIQYLGLWPNSPLLGTEALDMEWVRHGSGYIVQMIAGFYRSPDVMGWHAAAVMMLSLVLAMTTRGPTRWFWLLLAAAAVFPLLLCGRRKMVYMIPAFLVAVTALQLMAGGHRKILSRFGLIAVPLASLWIVQGWMGEESEQIRYYTDNPDDVRTQFQRHGFDSVIETYLQAGFFGSGMGVATPGSHHLQVARPRVWQESGPSRVMVELGAPGLLALTFLLAMILRSAWQVTRSHLRVRSPVAVYALGLLAFFIANVSGLIVSGQILADPFAATLLGLSVGLVLSLARVPVTGRDGLNRIVSYPGVSNRFERIPSMRSSS
ncbi:hypothetical protein [Thiocapsa roseopersicina]|uniref:O-Antigen ligase n=1 Tax=Thiocapsa roseopersicina TaxID=1058 RepID=A0A1H2QDF6_THIRO|nr:hypothetical protein [Thiocapsa roseopersicina]SDW04684.1 hypothetical protein SAMN05421783_101211 [Thiocapsa roseopersicina]